MAEALTLREAGLIARDQEAQPWHVATVLQLDGPVAKADLAVRIAERIAYAPRFRQKISGERRPAGATTPGCGSPVTSGRSR